MRYSIVLSLVFAIDFVVIALKVKHARHNKKNSHLVNAANSNGAHVATGNFSLANTWPVNNTLDGK
jgi:hypothetical protein